MRSNSIYQVDVNVFAEKAAANKQVLIRNQEEFLAVQHRLTTKEGTQFSVTSLVLHENGDGVQTLIPSVVKAPVSLETAELEPFVVTTNAKINPVMFGEVERFCPAYINVSCGDGAMLSQIMEFGDIHRIVRLGSNGKPVDEGFFLIDEKENRAINLATLSECNPTLFVADNVVDMCYGRIGVSSPGQLKKGEITLYCSNLPKFDAEAHLDKMTCGAYRLVAGYYNGKMEKLKALAQFSTRISQFKAGMVKTKPIGGIAISMFKLVDKRGNEWADGLMEAAAEDIADAFSDNDFLIMPSAMDGAASQQRPLVVNKGLAHVGPRRNIIEKIKATAVGQIGISEENWMKEHLVFLAQDELTDNQFENYMKAVLEKKGDYKDKTVVILPTFRKADGTVMNDEEKLGHIAVWVDLNVHKTVCDIRKPLTGHNVMGFDHGKATVEEEANVSTQLLASALYADPLKTSEVIRKKAADQADEIIARALATNGRRLRAKDLLGDISMAVQTVFPQFAVNHWAPYYQDALNKRLKGFCGRLEKLKIGTDGIYLKIVPDLSHYFGIDLLKYDAEAGTCEVLAPQLSREGIGRAIAVKYPKMATNEFAKLIPVSPDELAKRARFQCVLGRITKTQLRVIEHELRMLHEGIVMVPAIEELKNMLAGMDFDGDALVAYTDPTFVEIIWAIKPVATTIMENDEFAKFQAEQRGTR